MASDDWNGTGHRSYEHHQAATWVDNDPGAYADAGTMEQEAFVAHWAGERFGRVRLRPHLLRYAWHHAREVRDA